MHDRPAAVGAPWLFADVKHFLATGEHLPAPGLAETGGCSPRTLAAGRGRKGERRAYWRTRKHYAGYFKGIPDFKPMRIRLCTADTSEEVFGILDNILDDFSSRELF